MFYLFLLQGFLSFLALQEAFLPLIPGPLTAWIGILILSFAPSIELENQFLLFSFCISLAVFVLDNIIPVLGVKKFGGGKASIIGSSIGLFIGNFIFRPFRALNWSFFRRFSWRVNYKR